MNRSPHRRSSAYLATLLLVLGLAPLAAAGDTVDPEALYRRGAEAFARGDIDASLVAFDHLVRLRPTQKPQLWQRGISLYYAARWDACIDQFETHRSVNPHDVENSVWHYLCVAAKSGATTARERFFPAADRRIPMMEVHGLYAGTGSTEAVFAAVDQGNPSPAERRVRQFYADLYVGLWRLSRRETAAGLRHLEAALTGAPIGHYMEIVARVHRDRLRAADRTETREPAR